MAFKATPENFMKPQRLEGESFQEYKVRRCAANEYAESPARFRYWPSTMLGTYRKPK